MVVIKHAWCTHHRRRRQSTLTDEVYDEAAVGPVAGGPAEEGLAVWQLHDRARRGGEVDDVVAGVDQRVTEAE